VTALVLMLLLAISVVVFAVTLDKGPVDALYFAVTTALGNSTLDDSQAWLKVFGVGTMVAGGALLGVVFSYLASVATTSRLEERMGRRAKRLSGHVVVAGLGTVGYRVERLLFELGVPVAVIDRAPDPRFVDAVGERVPVLSGDVRVSENLQRAGVQDAFCLVACTDDDLTNVAACMEARRINPDIRTVARIFDERLAARVAGAFGIDAAVSATQVAAGAFVGAATDERALRSFPIGDREFLALRYVLPGDMQHDRIVRWRQDGVRILAFQPPDGVVQPPSALTGGLPAGSAAIVAGPAVAVRSLVLDG
jgi:Trk K+ transport system NAD-binding subunit